MDTEGKKPHKTKDCFSQQLRPYVDGPLVIQSLCPPGGCIAGASGESRNESCSPVIVSKEEKKEEKRSPHLLTNTRFPDTSLLTAYMPLNTFLTVSFT